MSKPDGKMHELGRNPSKRSPNAGRNQARPSISSVDSKELYSYTPNWITPQEKAKLKARVQRIKLKEQRSTMKEDVILLQASKKGSVESTDVTSEPPKGKGEAKKSSTSSDDGTDAEANLQRTKSERSVKSDKSKKPSKKGSTESVKKAKSKDSVKSSKSDKGKSKEDLKMSKKNEETLDKRKEAHANPSGNTLEKKPQREISTSNLDEHLWATEYAHFSPQLYHFKSPEKLSTKNPVMAECPPFWVLLDHTIAVTWKLFSADAERKDLGIIPLQWCREFVSAMRDERGEYLPATGQLLSAIEDALIDRYAKAADAEESEKDNKKDCGKGPCKKDQDNLSYVSSESIFKHPVEVSYTLKDIMSRNMPGRKPTEGEEGGVQCIVEPAVAKVDVPAPEDHETMSKSDMLNYLKQLKQEQDMRVQNEKEHSDKIAALMELLARGKVNGDPWVEGHDSKKKHDGEHVHFTRDTDDSEDKSQMGDGKKGAKDKEKQDKKPAKEDKKKKVSVDEDKKKKVSVDEDKKGKKEKDKDKRRKSDTSVSSKSSTQSN